MQVFLINPVEQKISAVETDGTLEGIRQLIGFDSIDSDELDASGDRLYFDEACFIRQQSGAGRFSMDSLAPVSGRGVVAGTGPGGAGPAKGALKQPVVTLEALRLRVRFL